MIDPILVLGVAGLASTAIVVVFAPWLFLVALALELAFGVLAWWWAHTWPLHAWSNERFAFWRLTWRRLTGR